MNPSQSLTAWRALALLPSMLLLVGAMSCGPVLAQGVLDAARQLGSGEENRTADDEFTRQLNELKRTFTELSRKIDEGTQSIGRLNDAQAARKEIEELRGHVAALLGAVADNGAVWELGNKALKRADDKLKALEAETRYKPEDRQFLIDRWRELRVGTEGAIKELEVARKDFAGLLRTLQTNEDFIDELLQVKEHERALAVIHQLTDGIRDASDKLKKLLTTLKAPGV
jgi:DNA repair exonuclease SbcCD ATPase subunit